MRHLLYSHDSYGLGHFRRSLLLARALTAASSDNEVLLVTGSPRSHSYALGERIDMVRVPAATKTDCGDYAARSLGLDLRELVRLRRSLVAAALDGYRPDVVLVDHAPLGLASELAPLVANRRTRWVLGLREIVDSADAVEAQWRGDGSWDALACYDHVLVYGDRRVLSTANELALADRLGVSVEHVGYLGRPELRRAPLLATHDETVVVTGGGGGDAFALVQTYLEYVESYRPAHRSMVVTGPLMASRRVEALAERASWLDVALVEFTPRLEQVIATAGAVISMAGYNTVVEEMSAGVPALLVPRCVPRLEQVLRARRVAPYANVVVSESGDFDADVVAGFVAANLRAPRVRTDLDLDGLERVPAALARLREVSYA